MLKYQISRIAIIIKLNREKFKFEISSPHQIRGDRFLMKFENKKSSPQSSPDMVKY